MKNSLWKGVFVVAFVLIPLQSMPASTADDLCGATIVEDLELDHDLFCSGNGLAIGADGIEVDLNGHTIAGSDVGIGILVAGRTDIRISGGTIRDFSTGIQVSNSSGVLISENDILDHAMDGVDFMAGSVDNTVKENEIRDNFTRGIMLRTGSADNAIRENAIIGNNVGILMFQPEGTTVKENFVAESRTAGIRVRFTAIGNLIEENQVVSNPVGIEFLLSPAGLPATGNSLVENTIATNTCGLKGPTTGNTLKENVFEGNVTDGCI